ncbi:response regulator transcription factor [Sutcliffiella cohnii]|uniref:response regulator transcription factor n=1 Tax=Sutcliffiella cohnii TaxID=33932 RepID=UPI00082D4185|nr:response regulator transcription factor [Sutcliffiella cohnii]
MDILGEEDNYNNGLRLVKHHTPQIVIDYLYYEEKSTFQNTLNFISETKNISKNTKVLTVNVIDQKEVVHQLLEAGVDGIYDGKTGSLIDVIKKMQKYKIYLSNLYQSLLLNEIKKASPFRKKTIRVNKPIAKLYLSKREIEVLEKLVSVGGNNDILAEKLYISPTTLKTHISNIMIKLNAENRTHIITTAFNNGLIIVE